MEKSSIGIISKANGMVNATDWGAPVVLQETSLVKLPFSLDMVQAYNQMDDTLIILLNNGEQVRVEGFFTKFEDEERSEIVLEGEDGSAWLGSFDPAQSEFVFSEISAADIAAAGETANAGAVAAGSTISTEAWVAGALGLLALAGIISSTSSLSSSSSSSSQPVIVLPTKPVIDDITNNFDEDGQLTDTTIRGETEPGSTVEVTDPETGEIVGSDTADEDGKFEVVVGGGLEDGKDYDVTAKDPAGNVSDKETITGDTTAPNTPVVEDVTNNFDEDGQLTDTTIRGEAEPGSTVEVTDPETGEIVGSDTADEDGRFEVVVAGGLEDGQDYEVTAKDPVGNVSDKETITGDTTAPNTPVVEDVTNSFDEDGNPTDTTIRGEAEPGSTVEVTDPETGEIVGSDTADEDGKFEVVVEGGLEDGKDYDVTAKDPAGNVSDKETITGDTTAPNTPVVEDVTNNFDEDGQLTDTTIRGEAEPGSTVEVTDPETGEIVGSDTADEDGRFEVVVAGGLEDGQDYEVTAKDPAGNVSDSTTITGNSSAPDAPIAQLAEDTGLSDDDGITSNGQIKVTGLEQNATWEYSTDGGQNWILGSEDSFTLSEGSYSAGDIQVRQTDAFGNTGETTQLGEITVDTQPPSIENVESYNVDSTSPANGEANKTLVTFKGELDATYQVTIGNTTITASNPDAEGNYTVTFFDPAQPGADVTISGTDIAGNSVSLTDNKVSDELQYDDSSAPDDTTTQVAIDSIAGDDVINAEESEGMVIISGTVTGEFTEGDTLTLNVAGGSEYTGTVDAAGRFAIEVEGSVFVDADDGSVTVTVTATDVAGNQGDITASKDYAVDIAPPRLDDVESYNVDTNSPADGEANKTVVSFKGEPGASYQVTIGDTTKVSASDDDGNHKVSFLPPAEMGAQVTITGTDAAGNSVSVTDNVSGVLQFDDTSAPDDGSTSVTVDAITDDNVINKAESSNQVAIKGTVEGEFSAGDTITISLGGNVIGTGNVDADGRFAIDVDGSVLAGADESSVSVTVTATSAAGVPGEITSEHAYSVDVDAPEVSQVATVTLDKSPADGTADITTVSFVGDDPDANYTVVIDKTTVVASGPDEDGFYVAEFPPQAAGQTVVITATDTAGNSATATDTTPTDITSGDTEVPEQPEISSVINSFDTLGELTGTVIKGTTSGGALVQLYDAEGTLINEVKANINGNFEFAGTVLANKENYSVSAKYELGNSSPAVTVVGDTEAPNVDTITIVQLDTSDPADSDANQTLLTFNTDEPDAIFAFSYLDKNGQAKAYTGEVTVSAQGNTVNVVFEPALSAEDQIIITGTDSYANTGSTTTKAVPSDVTSVGDKTPPELIDVSLEEETDAEGELTSHSFSFTTDDPTAIYSVTVDGVKHTGTPDITGVIGSQTYTYNFTPPLKAGDEVKVEATDPAGNTSSVTATAEIFLNITEVEQVDTDSPADGKADKTIVKFVANNKEPLTFSAMDADGKKIEVTVTRLNKPLGEDEDSAPWDYKVTFDPALLEGGKVFIVGQIDGLDEVVKDATVPNEITRFEDDVAPGEPTVDGFTNNKDDSSTTVKGTAEAGSTVKITDPDTDAVVGSGTVGDDGKFEITVGAGGLTDAKDYDVTATDKAGNISDSATVTGDTTPPAALANDAIEIGNNGDAFINATEIADGKVKVVIQLPKDAANEVLTEIGDILVVNGQEWEITQAHLDASKVELDLDVPKEDELFEVEAFIKDEHHNVSGTVEASATVDTVAPTKPVIDSVEADGTIVGHTEPGATITDTDGNPLKDAANNDILAAADGKFTIPADKVPTDGIIKAKDAAGNESQPINVSQLPGIEQGFDNVASVDEGGVATEYDTPAEHDTFSNNGFSNDATPYFEIPVGVTGLNEAVLIITQNGISTVAAATKIERDGKVYLEVADKLADGSYEVQYTTDNTLVVGTENPTIADNELSESLTFTVDTQSPNAPIIEEVQNTFDAAGEPTGTTISGQVQGADSTAEVGATVDVKDAGGNVVASGVTDQDGNFIINLVPALTDGDNYTVEATDKAGNTSKVSDSIIGDTTAPSAPSDILLGDDDNIAYINAAEAQGDVFKVTVTLPGAGVEAGDILVINGTDITITAGDLIAGKVEHQLSTDGYAEGEKITVEAVIKDALGNSNAGISADAILDTQAPEVEFKQVSPTTFTLKVSEAGTVVLSDADGNELKTIEVTEAQANTSLSVSFAEEFAANTQIKIATTDRAGNSTNTHVFVDNIRTEAADNTEELVLETVATQREAKGGESIVGEKITSFGVVSAGLGGVADAGVLDFASNAIELNVAEGTERTLELFADGGGISIDDTYDLIIYKEDAYGNTKFYDVYDSWFSVPFLGMTKEGEITITEPGKYHIMLSGKAGVKVIGGAGLEVTKDTVIDHNEYESVSGVHKGNVLTDLDVQSGKDQIDELEKTRITKITYQDSEGTHEVDVPAVGSKVIELTHGTLTVSAKGNYTYKLNEGAKPEFGDQEEVTYTITNSNTGDSSNAKLTINLVDKPSNLIPDSTVLLDMKPEAIAKAIPEKDKLTSKTWADIASVGLGIADIGLIAIENGMDINVGANEVRDVTFYGTGGAPVALGYSPVDLVIYKKETTANGDFWQLYTIEENWFGIVGVVVGAGTSSEDKTFRFDEGEYKAVLIPTTGGVSVIPSVTLRVREDKLYEYEQTNTQLEAELGLTEGAVVYAVNGDPLEAGDNVIMGQYGTLTIKADGSYSYELYQNIAYKDIGTMDTFSYSILGADNTLYNSTLNIVINNVEAGDDFGDVRFGLDNQEAYEGWAVSGTKGGAGNTTYSSDLIEVEANQVYDLTLNYNLNPTTSRVDEFVIRLIDVITGDVVETYKPAITGEQDELSWSLTEGQYRVEVIIDPLLANTVNYSLSLQGTITTLDKFQEEQANTLVEEGNILDNDVYKESSGQADFAHIEVNGKPLDIVVGEQFDNNLQKSLTIEGEHGTLVVQQDGSYTYTAAGDSYGVDVFDYKLISIAGSSDSAQLTFNVGVNASGSQYDDVISSTAGNDTFEGGLGSDTLRFDLLDEDDATGGNGVDTWTDFHFGEVGTDADADLIDLSELLPPLGEDVDLSDFLQVEFNAEDESITLSIDRDGAGSAFEFEELLVLTDQTESRSLDDLLNNEQIIY